MKIPRYKYYFALTDFLIIGISFLLSGYLFQNNSAEKSEFAAGIFIIGTVLFLLIFGLNHLYQSSTIEIKTKHIAGIVKSITYGVFSILIISLLLEPSEIVKPGLNIAAFTLSAFPLLYLVRIEGLRGLYYNQFSHKKNVIIIGNGESGRNLAALAENDIKSKLNVLGFVGYSSREESFERNYLGDINQLSAITKENKVDEIIISIDEIEYEELMDLLDLCNELNVKVKVASDRFSIVSQKLKIKKYAGITVVNASARKSRDLQLKLKRAVDIAGAVIGFILLAPLFLFLAAIIKLTSKGPVFYKQKRIGKGGRPFDFYKFRSMTVANENDEDRKKQMLEFMKSSGNTGQKIINESRVTWIGKYIRKTSVDELPQLFNVLKGDMSLVGPRPCLPYEYENYEPWQRRRCEFIPGCTGLWQVSGRSTVSFVDSIVLDLYYIKNFSIWFDIKLIIKTIPVMFFAKGGK